MLLLASFGYDVWGVEGSATAVKAARKLKEESMGKDVYAEKDEKVGTGAAEIVEGDFFEDAWWEETCGEEETVGFDLIYDYTVCETGARDLADCQWLT